MNELSMEYFRWIKLKLASGWNLKEVTSHEKLLAALMDRDFTYLMGMDGNRYADGIDLRYVFGEEMRIPPAKISTDLDDRPCSVLEMMTALALRCEADIMHDPHSEDRSASWFWGMVRSLGLIDETDKHFNQDHVDRVLDRFLARRYSPTGEGGLFTLSKPRQDLTGVEIWYQAMWYLTEQLAI